MESRAAWVDLSATPEEASHAPCDIEGRHLDRVRPLLPYAVERQGHVVDPKAFAPVLERFFGE
jgi:hypothetical protein